MQVFDASSMLYAWDNYPIKQFPPLWNWIARQIERKILMMPRVAFNEVADKATECGDWLKENELELIEVNNTILEDAMRIKGLLLIAGDNYHAKGVDENDIFIIATARAHKAELVSDEARQPGLPAILAKRKIPAVCSMKEVAVRCINFIEYLRRSDEIFG